MSFRRISRSTLRATSIRRLSSQYGFSTRAVDFSGISLDSQRTGSTRSSLTGFALDSAGGSFWAISGNTAFKLDMSSGAVLASFKSSDYLFDAVAVVGEPRAALAAPASIPTLSQWLFFALAIALGGVGVIRL